MANWTKECNQLLHLILGYAWNDVVSNDHVKEVATETAETNVDRKKKDNKLSSAQQENVLVLKIEEWTNIFFDPQEQYMHIPRPNFLTDKRMMAEVK